MIRPRVDEDSSPTKSTSKPEPKKPAPKVEKGTVKPSPRNFGRTIKEA